MAGLIYTPVYAVQASKIRRAHPMAGLAIDAIEHELERTYVFTKYPVVGTDKHGDIHMYKVPVPPIGKSVVVIFSFEDHPGERRIVLHDVTM